MKSQPKWFRRQMIFVWEHFFSVQYSRRSLSLKCSNFALVIPFWFVDFPPSRTKYSRRKRQTKDSKHQKNVVIIVSDFMVFPKEKGNKSTYFFREKNVLTADMTLQQKKKSRSIFCSQSRTFAESKFPFTPTSAILNEQENTSRNRRFNLIDIYLIRGYWLY